MAPSRGKGKSRAKDVASTGSMSSKRRLRNGAPRKNATPEIFEDMLAEAAVLDPTEDVDRPLKRRKIALSASSAQKKHQENGRVPESSKAHATYGTASESELSTAPAVSRRARQTAEQSSESDDGDFAFEDVDLENHHTSGAESAHESDGIADLSVSLAAGEASKTRTPAKRKPASPAEKAYRLLVHKTHFLCLLSHCVYVNSRCNIDIVQTKLLRLLTPKIVGFLNPRAEHSQFQRDQTFMDGLSQAAETFRGHFVIDSSGMTRAKWLAEGEDHDAKYDPLPMERSDFVEASEKLRGSQDTGNQLFCALLRAAGVEARLVCSLQLLPFGSVAAKPSTPQKVAKPVVYAIASENDMTASDVSADDRTVQTSRTIGMIPSPRRRLGQPGFAPESAATPVQQMIKRPVRKLHYPAWWVEAFNDAHQKWVSVDPLVTRTINKPSRLEPPASYDLNQMSYVFAFEADGVAKDVTRRYARSYNAKTRRQRLESTESGAQWLKSALRFLRRRERRLDREQVEDGELMQKESREGLPRNVLDFKDHPYYALERHLKRNEVLHPRREVGKVNAGTNAKPRMEPVFRRQDVLVCRSADKWYRLGREVKAGEHPLKHVVSRSRPAILDRHDGDDGNEPAKITTLYAASQTELYVPPSVVDGRVPRNGFGNLDIYVPSMVPAGGAHIRHTLAQQAARLLRVDYADAVTGFQFKGRHGTAVIEGIIVAQQYAEAVQAVIEGFEHVQKEDESKGRSLAALKMWKRLLVGLRIAERVNQYGASSVTGDVKQAMNDAEDEDERTEDAGGFLPDDATSEDPLPTAGRFFVQELASKPTKRSVRKARDDESEDESMVYASDDDKDHVYGELSHDRSRNSSEHHDGEGGGGVVLEDGGEYRSGIDGKGRFLMSELAENDGPGGFLLDGAGEDNDQPGGFLTEVENRNTGDVGGAGFFPNNEELVGNQNARSPTERPPIGERREQAADANHTAMHDARSKAQADNHSAQLHAQSPAGMASPEAAQSASSSHLSATTPPDDAPEELSDHGSLISHDPEDDDAEPDWLESD